MKCFFQILDKKTGQRSRAVSSTRHEFACQLQRLYRDDPAEAYVLVLVDDLQTDIESEWNFSIAPLVTIQTFVDQYAAKEVA